MQNKFKTNKILKFQSNIGLTNAVIAKLAFSSIKGD